MIKKITKYWKKRKLLKRYTEKPINPNLYGIVNAMSVQPLTAPVSGSVFSTEYVYGSKNVNANEVLKNIDRLLEIIDTDDSNYFKTASVAVKYSTLSKIESHHSMIMAIE